MSKVKLKESVYAACDENGELLLGSNPLKEAYCLQGLSPIHKRILELLDGSYSLEEMVEILQYEQNIDCSEIAIEFIEQLKEISLVEECGDKDNRLAVDEYERYSRQLLLFSSLNNNTFQSAVDFQAKLKNTHIGILGIGGTGGHTLYALAAMGVGKITAVDFDRVELSNLSRQILYNEKDIGKLKTEAAQEKVRFINKDVEMYVINKKLNNEKDIELAVKGCDFVILQADMPRGKIRKMVNTVCCKLNIPFLCFAGTGTDSAKCGPIVIPGETACYECSLTQKFVEAKENYIDCINRRYTTTVIEPYNAIVANLGVMEVVKHITGYSPCRLYNSILEVDFDLLTVRFRKIVKNERCPVCGDVHNERN